MKRKKKPLFPRIFKGIFGFLFLPAYIVAISPFFIDYNLVVGFMLIMSGLLGFFFEVRFFD